VQFESITSSLDESGVFPLRKLNVVENELDREAVLFNPDTGATHRLNETALAVWRQCNGRIAVRQIADGLNEKYDVDPETALQHVEQLIVVFAEAGLLEKDLFA
jgi:PqqD family protein of HPr-rel-A system